MSKCAFGVDKVEYLGYVNFSEGVIIDPSKIQAMVDWPTPTNIKALRGFLGLTGYYRRFIKNYGLLSKPLTSLEKKDQFKWSLEAEDSFTTLKKTMTIALVLALPNFKESFALETNNCESVIGAILLQQKRLIAYFSKALALRTSASRYMKRSS